ncbi:MAG: hypothetical protein V3R88_03465 [Alphaproteobacteria bacterium]
MIGGTWPAGSVLGQHTAEVLAELLGMGDDGVADLRGRSVI